MADVSELPMKDDEPLVIESVTWLDGSPAPQRSARPAPEWLTLARERLTTAGVVAVASGLASLLCFLLPWFVAPLGLLQSVSGPRDVVSSGTVGVSGWSIAYGMPAGVGPDGPLHLAVFVHLWLIPLAAIALLVIAWYAARRRISDLLAAAVILALSVLAVLVTLGYVVQVTSLAHVLQGIGVGWGCWLALAASLITGTAAANLLRPAVAPDEGGDEA